LPIQKRVSGSARRRHDMKTSTKATEKQQAVIEKLREEYLSRLDDNMGQLHNQFVAYISASALPLPQVALVLEILLKETVDEAVRRYMGA
jgi:hypothetical protein